MNLNAILSPEIYTTSYQREQCRHALTSLRMARSRAQNDLLDLCCDLQKNPASLNPERISQTVAEIRYLDSRAEELERFLSLSRTAEMESGN